MLDRRTFVGAVLGVCTTVHAEDAPNTHNMMIVGEETAFLSHLPMFRANEKVPELNATKTEFTSPHRFQVILEAAFTIKGKDVTPSYFKDRKRNPKTKMYTLQPSRFVLSRLFTPDAQNPQLRSFPATVFRGHLERPGNRAILENVTVEVRRVIDARQLDPNTGTVTTLEYFLFGKGREMFVAHRIMKPPDFDQIVSVVSEDQKLTTDQLSRGVRVTVPARKNRAGQRIREGEKVAVEMHIGTPPVRAQIQAAREFYFEEGELLSPPTFDPTEEERKSGF